MIHLVFTTQQEAQEGIDKVDAKVREILEEKAPLDIDENGVIPRNAATGELQPGATRTNTWAIPQQRSDGKWCFPIILESQHPLFTGVDFTEDILGYTEENYDPQWFT